MDHETDEQVAREATASEVSPWDSMVNWTQEERDYWFMGPFDGGIPGMVRRIRRILDVSQRGLAALLDVSQSVVARWETGRTSPRMSVVQRLLRMARVGMTFHDEETGEPVGPMRADGATTHAGSRYPAHADLRVAGWWVPRRLRNMTSIEAFRWWDRSMRVGDPAMRYRRSPFWKQLERELYGTPDDHPALHQFVAEMRYIDERREDRNRARQGRAA
ncbi:helix-turn-helix domain-containing protein [Nocardioides zhouii]|uniref:XRE family transcriptional regulator n=1 Tax=Nocardioides zhouii TaxID=1168729 RepID=A0A4Q2T2P8_9ACTN|nr:helix-turn-helix transcriptional regulator [Nocardioides zhouii]RYC12975.1 XRE family transcriptional regulator [Nocardioides zhouii]